MNISTSGALRYAAILAFPVALAALGTVVLAQTDTTEPNAATYICRPALTDEAPSAKMVHTSMALVCRPIAVSMHMSDGSMKTIGNVKAKALVAPDFSHAVSPAQVNAAYNHWVEMALDIDPETRHSP
jgi:hypothetical protein